MGLHHPLNDGTQIVVVRLKRSNESAQGFSCCQLKLNISTVGRPCSSNAVPYLLDCLSAGALYSPSVLQRVASSQHSPSRPDKCSLAYQLRAYNTLNYPPNKPKMPSSWEHTMFSCGWPTLPHPKESGGGPGIRSYGNPTPRPLPHSGTLLRVLAALCSARFFFFSAGKQGS